MTVLGRALALAVILLGSPRPVLAADCAVTLGFRPSQVDPCDTIGQIPPNGILRARQPDSLAGPSRLGPATDINARLACSRAENAPDCVSVDRVLAGSIGGRLRSRHNTGCITDLFIEGDPDTVAPKAPFIAGVAIDLVTRPGTCDVDSLLLRIDDVLDDRAPARLLQLALYVGATEEEARTRVPIDHLLEVFDGTTSVTLDANLGPSEGRERPIARGLLAAGRHCVAVETVDWAGNFSPRSAPVCFDHTNEADPFVRRVARNEDAAGCASTSGAPNGSWLLVLVFALAAQRFRRKRR